MVEAADNIANDPINDPAMQEKLREAGRQMDRRLLSDEVLPGVKAEDYKLGPCAIC